MLTESLLLDSRIVGNTHIPYIGSVRVPYWCFGESGKHLQCKYCCDNSIQYACKYRRFDAIEWSPVVIRVRSDLGNAQEE